VKEDLIIEAGRTEAHYWRDLWRYRELFGFLAWRDILVRYKQTVIGLAWALIRPLLTILVSTVIFGRIAGLSSEGLPYPVMVCAGTLPWYFFSSALSDSSQSLVGNASLISKVYFPRLILPASSVIVAFVDFGITMGILAAMMAWYHVWPTLRMLWMPVFIVLALITALGPGLLVTALNVKYRDFRYIIPFIVQFGQFVTPVMYSSEEVQKKFGETGLMLYSLNPMVGVVDGFRWCLHGGVTLHAVPFSISCLVSVVLLTFGTWYFRRTEKSFADVI
jgi:homopolymeric O-antigen transport system permease protein